MVSSPSCGSRSDLRKNWLKLISGTVPRKEGGRGRRKRVRESAWEARRAGGYGWNGRASSATNHLWRLSTLHSYKDSVRTSQRTQGASIIKTNRWPLLRLLSHAPPYVRTTSVPITDTQVAYLHFPAKQNLSSTTGTNVARVNIVCYASGPATK